jgi:predicted RNA-binding protein
VDLLYFGAKGGKVCLAKAYLNKWNNEPVLQDISHIWLDGGQVQMETLLGEGKVISGRVVEVDFTTSRILLDEDQEDDKSR